MAIYPSTSFVVTAAAMERVCKALLQHGLSTPAADGFRRGLAAWLEAEHVGELVFFAKSFGMATVCPPRLIERSQ